MNSFVDYLNSMNNASSDTIAALAESQVHSPFFRKIQIGRNLGKYLADRISSGEHLAVVLTGHAGDGKTSILIQILQDLGFLDENSSLEPEKEYYNVGDGISLYAVKDMSELQGNSIYFSEKMWYNKIYEDTKLKRKSFRNKRSEKDELRKHQTQTRRYNRNRVMHSDMRRGRLCRYGGFRQRTRRVSAKIS